MKPSIERKTNWISYVIIPVAFMGLWGALVAIPERNGFPPTLGYILWALTMIPAAFVGLINMKWKLGMDIRSFLFGLLAGPLGASEHLLPFFTLTKSPAYLVFHLLFGLGKLL
jgi:hypothetical protein